MHRQPILDLFKTYLANYPAEHETVDRIRCFVEEHSECFSRELETGHITGSAWVVDQSHTQVLLTHHKKLNIWVQLGGHSDGDADVSRVAMKEAREESGLAEITFLSPSLFDIDIHLIPARKKEAEHFHYDCRFLLEAKDIDYIVSEESHDLSWVPLEKVGELTQEESMLRMVNKTKGFFSPS